LVCDGYQFSLFDDIGSQAQLLQAMDWHADWLARFSDQDTASVEVLTTWLGASAPLIGRARRRFQ
jgi:hypothetical protein